MKMRISIRLNKKQYLVPDARLYGQKVEVRYDPLEQTRVYVWCDDQFFGEAHRIITAMVS